VTAVVGIGMLAAVAGFLLGGPIIGIGIFLLVWAFTVVAIIGYHMWNTFSPRGVDHAQFHFEAEPKDDKGTN
jgi:hypothetical protein